MNDFLIDICLLFPNIALGFFFFVLAIMLIIHTVLYFKDNK